MPKFSPAGKPLCSRCRSLAAYTIHVTSGGQTAYSYQCVNHLYASSQLLTAAHIDALSLDHRFYYRHLFKAWLTAHPDMTVGCSADEFLCPLAHFSSLYYERRCLVAFPGDVRAVEGGCLLFRLPAWARVFTLVLDFTHPSLEITGTQALELLQGVPTIDQVLRRLVEDTDRNEPTLLSVG